MALKESTLFVQQPQLWKPHAGQKIGEKFLVDHPCSMLLADPGVGKTSITLSAFKKLKAQGIANRMLLIAPLKPCYLVWPKELRKWKNFQGLTHTILHGPKKDDALQRGLDDDVDIFVMNPEGLEWLIVDRYVMNAAGRKKPVVDLGKIRSYGFDTLTIDELSKFKHTTSGRFKTLKEIQHTFARRWGLTGSPASNGLEDLFGQALIIDGGRSLGRFITHYRNKYFLPNFNGFGYTLRKGAEQEIYEAIAPIACRLDANDYIDMPELVYDPLTFELPAKARKIYDQFEDEMIANLDGKEIIASNAGAVSMKCRQITNGALYLDPDVAELMKGKFNPSKLKREWVELHTEKLEILGNLVDELQGSPLLVAYDFKHDLERLQAKFGKDVPYLGGGVSPEKSVEIEAAWNRGEIPLLFGHPQSIGHGLNLQEKGNHVAWFAMTWDFELWDQFIRRVWRQGNNAKRVFVHPIIAKDTVDETMFYTMKSKNKTQKALLDALKAMRKTRRK